MADQSQQPNGSQRTPTPKIDMERLAEKVYRLMREEMRLEQARSGRRKGR